MIIGISGKIGSGKDTVAKIIQYLTCKNKFPDKFHNDDTFEALQEYWEDGNSGIGSQWKDGGWEIKKFAGKLKQIVSLLTGIPVRDLEKEEVKNSYLGEEWDYWEDKTEYGQRWIYEGSRTDIEESKNCKKHRMTVRSLLQLLGTEALRYVIHPNVHINALFADYKVEGDLGKRKIDFFKSKGVDDFSWLKRNDHSLYQDLKIEFFEELNKELPNWLITDVRFPNEDNSVIVRNGITIRVNRPIRYRFPELWNLLIGSDDLSEYAFLDRLSKYDIELYKKLTHESETSLDNKKDWKYILDNDGTIEDLIEKVKIILKAENII